MRTFVPQTRCLSRIIASARNYNGLRSNSGDSGSGSIKEAGGAFGRRGTAREEQFFHEKERELLKNLSGHLDEQIEFHQEQIKLHQNAIEKIRKKMADMKNK